MPARRLGREEKKAETRLRLLDAAAKVFAREGFHAASLEQVAEEAGFSKGAVYSNFASKQELFGALLADRCQGSLLTVAGALDQAGSVADGLDRVGQAVTERVAQDRDWTLLFFELWAQAARNPDLRAGFADVYEQARGTVAGLIDARAAQLGAELPAPAEVLASLCVAVMDGLALQYLVDPERVPSEAARTALRLLLAALVAADQDRPPDRSVTASRRPVRPDRGDAVRHAPA